MTTHLNSKGEITLFAFPHHSVCKEDSNLHKSKVKRRVEVEEELSGKKRKLLRARPRERARQIGDEVEVDLPDYGSKQRRKRGRSFPRQKGRSPMPALYLLGKSDDRTWDPCRNRAEKGQAKSKRIEPRPLFFSLSFFILFF